MKVPEPGPDRLQQIARELLRTRDRFRRRIENIRGYFTFSIDHAGTITSWNRGMERVLVYPEDDVVGRPFGFFFPPEDQEKGEAARNLGEATRLGKCFKKRWPASPIGKITYPPMFSMSRRNRSRVLN